MKPIWIVNASPLITFAKAGHLKLLLELCPSPIIPQSVADEILQGREIDPARQWMQLFGHQFVVGQVVISPSVAAWDMGCGESEVLSLALTQPGAKVVVDDLVARKCAYALGIPVIGGLGLVILAKRLGLISNASPVFDDLIRSGLRINSSILNRAQIMAGELNG